MAELFSQYFSGAQLTAGTIVGSATGVSGLNPLVDRLNSVATSNGELVGSTIIGTISGTTLNYVGAAIISGTDATVAVKDLSVSGGAITAFGADISCWGGIIQPFFNGHMAAGQDKPTISVVDGAFYYNGGSKHFYGLVGGGVWKQLDN